MPSLNLIVIRARDIEVTGDYYRALGCRFEKHRHGNGPEHLSCQFNGLVFEIYPATDKSPPESTRLGFKVDSITSVVETAGAPVASPTADSEWGLRAVVKDPDGRKVELTEKA